MIYPLKQFFISVGARFIRPIKRASICLVLVLLIADTHANAAVEQPSTTSNTLTSNSVDSDTRFSFGRKLSLHYCFEKADENNKEVLLAASNLPVAQASMVIAKAIPNPTYNMAYGFGPAWKYVIAGNNQQMGWNEEIQVAGKRTKKMNLAHANYLQIAFDVEAVRFDVHNRVRRSYIQLVMASAYTRLIHSQENTFQKLFDIAQKRYTAGKAAGSELLQAKLNVMQLETQRNQSQGRLVSDSAQLAFLLGESPKSEEVILPEEISLENLLSGTTGIVPDSNHELPSLEQLLPVAWHERNDLKAAIQHAYANRKALSLARSQRIPDPFIGFNYMFSTYTPFQTQYFTPQPNARKVPFQPGYMVTVAEETPIFYQYKGEINQAKATWIQQLKQNEQLHTQVAVDIVSAYESLLTTKANLRKFQQDLLPAALRAAHLSRRSYELGKTDLSTAILAQQQYGQLASSYFDCAIAYQNNWADMEKAVGIPLNL